MTFRRFDPSELGAAEELQPQNDNHHGPSFRARVWRIVIAGLLLFWGGVGLLILRATMN